MTAPQPPADGLVLTFYGDDFTGSTDVMETLEDLGLSTLLFLDPPTPDEIAATVLHLASPANGAARGAIVPVYGKS